MARFGPASMVIRFQKYVNSRVADDRGVQMVPWRGGVNRKAVMICGGTLPVARRLSGLTIVRFVRFVRSSAKLPTEPDGLDLDIRVQCIQ